MDNSYWPRGLKSQIYKIKTDFIMCRRRGRVWDPKLVSSPFTLGKFDLAIGMVHLQQSNAQRAQWPKKQIVFCCMASSHSRPPLRAFLIAFIEEQKRCSVDLSLLRYLFTAPQLLPESNGSLVPLEI